jgi:release factor glutamine methyltransferase
MTRAIDLLQTAAAEFALISGTPRLDAEVLLAHSLRCTRGELGARAEGAVREEEALAFRRLAASRLQGVPVAYLTGVKEFWSLPLRVSPAVLVPRPETEILVERALALIDARRPFRLVDLGTGSGAIALAIASERRGAQITATDISEAALDVARGNASALGLEGIRWRRGSWLDAVPGERFDLIVSNPPYVAAADAHLAALKAEPLAALTPGSSGLEAYQAIIPAARSHLSPGGWIAFEHGAAQAGEVANLLELNGFLDVTSHPDYSGTLRVTLGSLHSNA